MGSALLRQSFMYYVDKSLLAIREVEKKNIKAEDKEREKGGGGKSIQLGFPAAIRTVNNPALIAATITKSLLRLIPFPCPKAHNSRQQLKNVFPVFEGPFVDGSFYVVP